MFWTPRWFCLGLFGWLGGFVFALALASAGAAENPLSISILKTERSPPRTSYLLVRVENKSDQRFEATQWSCVFYNGPQPVHEERSFVQNVPPRGHAIERIIQDYGGPFDNVECRFMSSRPSTRP
jgi:hypothetical protein